MIVSVHQTGVAMLHKYMPVLLTTSVLTAAPAVHGQEAADEQARGVLEQVTVTARRRSESQQDVPLSVSALDAAALERIEVNTMSDLQREVPSLDLTGASPSRSMLAFSLRGQRTNEFQLLSDPPVGTYFAEVVQPRPTGFGKALFDLQSVQVLKGVQGTLFGRNMTGGALLVEPAHPADEFNAKISVGAGDFELREVSGMLNVPLGDAVAVRVAGKSREREGFSTDMTSGLDLDDENVDAWRVSLSVRPSDDFESLSFMTACSSATTARPSSSVIPQRRIPPVSPRTRVGRSICIAADQRLSRLAGRPGDRR